MQTDAVPYVNSYFGKHKYQSGQYFNCFGNESSLANCHSSTSSSCDTAGIHCRGEIITGTLHAARIMKSVTTYYMLYYNYWYTEQCNMNGQVRLAGGKSDYEGRVEICSNGAWGTVYDGGWDVREATVVCGQLGFPISSNLSY